MTSLLKALGEFFKGPETKKVEPSPANELLDKIYKGYEEADEQLLNHIVEHKKSHTEIWKEKEREYVLQRNRGRDELEKYFQNHRMEEKIRKDAWERRKMPKPKWIHG